MSLHDLNSLRKARKIVNDLEKALKVVRATESSLENYKIYAPVAVILTTIKTAKPLLEMSLDYYKIIQETKGEKRR